MFDFEKLTVYQKAKEFNKFANSICFDKSIDRVTANQLKRASLSIPLNIAEGTGRLTNKDKRNFYVIARGSTFDCVAIFNILQQGNNINNDDFVLLYNKAEELSMILYSMIKKRS